MTTEALDRRSQKTRAALRAAFVDQVLAHGYDAVQVSAVIAQANVGRSTFYEHFRSKGDLLRASIEAPFTCLAAMVVPAAAPAHIIPVLRHFRDNQRVARVLLGPSTRSLLGQALAALIAQKLDGTPSVPAGIAARMIADAQLALVEAWILGRPACTVEAAAEAMQRASAAMASALGAAAIERQAVNDVLRPV